jgi:hypothetical protein
MWETVVVVLIVGVALLFTGRSIVRSLKGEEKGGCSGGCSGCSCASLSREAPSTGKEVKQSSTI